MDKHKDNLVIYVFALLIYCLSSMPNAVNDTSTAVRSHSSAQNQG